MCSSATSQEDSAGASTSHLPSPVIPSFLFLDEPTTGFDPSARRRSWSLIENLRSLGKTILLTTHYMDEAQELADRVAVMTLGRIAAEGAPAMLAGRANGAALVRFRLPEEVDAGRDSTLRSALTSRSPMDSSVSAPILLRGL